MNMQLAEKIKDDTRNFDIILKTKCGETKKTTVAKVCLLALELHMKHPNDMILFCALKNYEKMMKYLIQEFPDQVAFMLDDVCGSKEDSPPRLVRFIADGTLNISFPKVGKR